MNKDSMNQGVQILLERMDTNPEEFEDYAGKWGDIIGAILARKNSSDEHSKDAPLPFLTDAEVNALYDKLEDVRRENFTADVLRRLADDSVKQQELWETIYTTSRLPIGANTNSLTTGTWGSSSITTAGVLSLGEAQKEQLVKALDEYKHQQSKKIHRTSS
jgi:hypothetical protein